VRDSIDYFLFCHQKYKHQKYNCSVNAPTRRQLLLAEATRKMRQDLADERAKDRRKVLHMEYKS
jgi:hypothetical protein